MKKIVKILLLNLLLSSSYSDTIKDDDKMKTLPKKMLARRREEHLALLKGVATNAKYEWRFQLVEIGVNKVTNKFL